MITLVVAESLEPGLELEALVARLIFLQIDHVNDSLANIEGRHVFLELLHFYVAVVQPVVQEQLEYCHREHLLIVLCSQLAEDDLQLRLDHMHLSGFIGGLTVDELEAR